MNKKTLSGVLLCVFVCIGFFVVSNYMPEIVRSACQAVFTEFNNVNLFFVLGLFVMEILALRKWGKDRRCYYLCLGITVAAAFLVLGDTNYTERLVPGANTTLIQGAFSDENSTEEGRQTAFAMYYFDGRNLVVPEAEKEDSEHGYIYEMAVPARRVVTGSESAVSEDEAWEILSYPCKEYQGDYFVLDEFWEHTKNIQMVTWGDGHIFCSQELIDALRSPSGGTVLSGEGVDLVTFAEKGSFREIKQVFIALLLLLIGAVIVLPVWGRDFPYLAWFLSLPVGAAVWCVSCVLFTILNIPYNLVSVSVCTVLGVGIRLFSQRDKWKRLDGAVALRFVLLAAAAAVFFSCFKIFNLTTDGLTRCLYTYRLVNFGSFRDVLEEIAPYGFLEPTIMSIGYLLKCDMVYVFYPLMAVCGIGIMCAGLYYINGKKIDTTATVIAGVGILLLFTNFDYVLSGVFQVPHGPIAVYFLIFFMFIVMKKQINIEKYEWIVVIAATVILLTRIEGAVYVMFFLALSLGLEDKFLKLDKVILAVAAVTAVWNVFQMIVIGKDGNPMFWTPERGAVLIVGAFFVVVLSRLIRSPWGFLAYVKKHYFLLLTGGLCLATAMVLVLKRDTGMTNLQIYLSHFSNNERMNARINAGAIWTFVLLMCPIMIKKGSRLAKYTASAIGGYIVLIFFICLFREGALLHYGYTDSARRTLVQIMPAAMWLLAYLAGDREYKNE